MPEFLKLWMPAEAREMLFANISAPISDSEEIDSRESLGRVAAEDIIAAHPLPPIPAAVTPGVGKGSDSVLEDTETANALPGNL